MTVNQAGTHLVGWVGGTNTVYRLEGTVNQQDESGVTARAKMSTSRGSYPARLVFSGNEQHMVLKLHWSSQGTSGTWRYFRSSLDAIWSERAVSALPKDLKGQARARIRQPLTIAEKTYLRAQVGDMVRRRLPDIYAVSGINARVKAEKLFSSLHHELVSSGMWTGGKLLLARRFLAQDLQLTTSKFGADSMPDWDWLLRSMITWKGAEARRASKALGINLGSVTSVGPIHVFKWKLVAIGASSQLALGAGVFEVYFGFRLLEPEQSQDRLDGWMIQASLGFSTGLSAGFSTGWQDHRTIIPYRAGDLNGSFDIQEAGGGASAFGLGAGASATLVTLRGTGTLPPLHLPASVEMAGGAEAGVGWKGSWGKLGGGKPTRIPARQTRGRVTAPHSASSETHFAFDDPSLTASGRQKIREFVARELKALRSPETLVTITGHASTKGPPKRNDPLSELRAKNAAQAIRDVGGPTVQAKIVHEGLGETKAREVDPDDTRNPQWRRVDIALNGIVVEQLRIADE